MKNEAILLYVLVLIAPSLCLPDGISSATVTQSRKSVENFWTKEKLLAAKEVFPDLSANFTAAGKSTVDLPHDTPILIGDVKEYDNNQSTDSRAARNQYRATTGRVFWSCPGSGSYSCSGSVIYSNTRNLIVTAGHCVFDTNTLRWFTNCNWVFIPGYANGNAPYGRWFAKTLFSFTSYTRRYPDYNYDVGFVVLNPSNGVRIGSVITPQAVGFNYPYGRASSSFGYPVNLGNGQTLQSCTNVPYNIPFYINGIQYRGQGLRNCGMGGGCSGGPWLQQLNSVSGTGITYSVNSFIMYAYPNTLFGPMFDTSIYYGWNVVQNY